MAKDGKEPQSYGSGPDWVSGKTGQSVNEQADTPPPEHQAFYDERRTDDTSSAAQGGLTSDVQRAERSDAEPAASPAEGATARITAQTGGAKRDSYFKKRDYEKE